jgi:hypothetical protein
MDGNESSTLFAQIAADNWPHALLALIPLGECNT